MWQETILWGLPAGICLLCCVRTGSLIHQSLNYILHNLMTVPDTVQLILLLHLLWWYTRCMMFGELAFVFQPSITVTNLHRRAICPACRYITHFTSPPDSSRKWRNDPGIHARNEPKIRLCTRRAVRPYTSGEQSHDEITVLNSLTETLSLGEEFSMFCTKQIIFLWFKKNVNRLLGVWRSLMFKYDVYICL